MSNLDSYENYLEHYGVKGMKWGVRKDRPEGVSAKTNRAAKKDASEFARAKMFYGEGAGTRRKLIREKVASRSKSDPAYKKAFDHHYERQDLGKHGEKARGERARKDAKKSVGRTVRGVKNLAMGSGAAVSVGGLVAYAAIQNPQVQEAARNAASKTMSAARNYRNRSAVQDYLKNSGFF